MKMELDVHERILEGFNQHIQATIGIDNAGWWFLFSMMLQIKCFEQHHHGWEQLVEPLKVLTHLWPSSVSEAAGPWWWSGRCRRPGSVGRRNWKRRPAVGAAASPQSAAAHLVPATSLTVNAPPRWAQAACMKGESTLLRVIFFFFLYCVFREHAAGWLTSSRTATLPVCAAASINWTWRLRGPVHQPTPEEQQSEFLFLRAQSRTLIGLRPPGGHLPPALWERRPRLQGRRPAVAPGRRLSGKFGPNSAAEGKQKVIASKENYIQGTWVSKNVSSL